MYSEGVDLADDHRSIYFAIFFTSTGLPALQMTLKSLNFKTVCFLKLLRSIFSLVPNA